jgi:hypothetical protein
MTGIKGKSGGAREGAGRPKKEPTEVISFRVPKKQAKKLKVKIQKLIDEEK